VPNRIYLSPSTQEKNTCKFGDSEENHMNIIGDKAEALLKRQGFVVFRNRPEMTLAEVIAESNRMAVDIHLALHSNAGGGMGTEVYVWKEEGRVTNSERLGQLLYDAVAPLTPNPDRGVKDGKYLGEVGKTKATAALIEIAFHDREDEARWIHENTEKIATAIVKAVCKYFEVPFRPPEVVPQAQIESFTFSVGGKGYRVVIENGKPKLEEV